MMRLFKSVKLTTLKAVMPATPPVKENIQEAKMALNEIEHLWRKGDLREALQKIEEVEKTYPSCSKAAKYYRGEIGVEMLEKAGELPKQS